MGAWADMGAGVEVGRVCAPKVTPLPPLPVREVEHLLPPPDAYRRRWVLGVSPFCVPNFSWGPPIWGMVCVGCGPNFARGFLLGGK